MDKKSNMDHHFTPEELDQMERDLERVAPEAEPCQPPAEPPGGSRYKRGRRWWEQSKWERKR